MQALPFASCPMFASLRSSLHDLITRVLTVVVILATIVSSLVVSQNARAQLTKTDVNLVLAIDCSYSVNKAEFDLQVQGIAAALTSKEVIEAIEGGQHGRIGLSVYQWSGPQNQVVVMPWTVVGNEQEARAFAARLLAEPRQTAEGVTAIGSALSFAVDHLNTAPFPTERKVIDMQADGASTWSRGLPIRAGRDKAVAQGIVINGLPILNEVSYLHYYFENHVIGGEGAFIEIAKDYKSFAKAIKRKLLREIQGQFIS